MEMRIRAVGEYEPYENTRRIGVLPYKKESSKITTLIAWDTSGILVRLVFSFLYYY